MKTPLLSSRSRRRALGLALAALAALAPAAAEAQPQRSLPAVPQASAGDSFSDFLLRLLLGILGEGDAAHDLEPATDNSELDSEIEIDPPNPVVQPDGERPSSRIR